MCYGQIETESAFVFAKYSSKEPSIWTSPRKSRSHWSERDNMTSGFWSMKFCFWMWVTPIHHIYIYFPSSSPQIWARSLLSACNPLGVSRRWCDISQKCSSWENEHFSKKKLKEVHIKSLISSRVIRAIILHTWMLLLLVVVEQVCKMIADQSFVICWIALQKFLWVKCHNLTFANKYETISRVRFEFFTLCSSEFWPQLLVQN